jgi:hypothetical protein
MRSAPPWSAAKYEGRDFNCVFRVVLLGCEIGLLVRVSLSYLCCMDTLNVATEVASSGGLDFLLNNWAALVLGMMAFIKVVVNLTPTEKDNQVFGWLDTLINVVISDKKKS